MGWHEISYTAILFYHDMYYHYYFYYYYYYYYCYILHFAHRPGSIFMNNVKPYDRDVKYYTIEYRYNASNIT